MKDPLIMSGVEEIMPFLN